MRPGRQRLFLLTCYAPAFARRAYCTQLVCVTVHLPAVPLYYLPPYMPCLIVVLLPADLPTVYFTFFHYLLPYYALPAAVLPAMPRYPARWTNTVAVRAVRYTIPAHLTVSDWGEHTRYYAPACHFVPCCRFLPTCRALLIWFVPVYWDARTPACRYPFVEDTY